MRWFKLLFILMLSLGLRSLAAESADAHAGGESHGEHAVEGLPTAAPVLFKVGPLVFTNSMLAALLGALAVVAFASVATRNMKAVPDGAQNFWEWLVEGLYEFLEGIVGSDLIKKTFWFFAALFLVIVTTNWFGLLPGVGTIGWGTPDAQGHLHHISRPLLRGGNADFNMTFAIAMVFFVCWTIWALQANGIGGFLLHIFGPKGDTAGLMKLLMIVVFLAVGLLEVVSILFRPISLSFRLFGNVFAGENMLETMTHLGGPAFGWLTALPFYFMELLVGVVQALVFMLLTAVFTLLICTHDDEGHGHGAEGKHH